MRLTPDQRHSLVDAVKRGINKNIVADVFNTSVKTVIKWCRRACHRGKESFRDKQRKPRKRKVTEQVELTILALRTMFEWGTDRIQKGVWCLPKFMLESLSELKVRCAQGVRLSRTAINDILKKHELNGYKNISGGWKFFRVKKPNELWQLDVKGPFRVKGKKHWFVVCIDDYSRYLLLAEQFSHCPALAEMCSLLMSLTKRYKPKQILTDNNPFEEEWGEWCKANGIEPLHAHPYYPQGKGKVERAIRNVAEEFVYLLKKFPAWLEGEIKEFQKWFNTKRFHNGIQDYPARLFREVRKFT